MGSVSSSEINETKRNQIKEYCKEYESKQEYSAPISKSPYVNIQENLQEKVERENFSPITKKSQQSPPGK